MSDKIRSGFPVSITFSDGELPTAAKLRGLARQARNGLTLLEYAIGDLWNQAGDTVITAGGTSTANALMTANLGRLVGASKHMSPYITYRDGVGGALPLTYKHEFYSGDGWVGRHECRLPLLPAAGTSYTWSGTNAPSGSPQSTAGAVDASGEWYIDTATGRCFFYNSIAVDWGVIYNIATEQCDQDSTTTHNIIPDPDTDTSFTFRGCKIAYSNNTNSSEGYIIYLPPRGPLSTRVLTNGPQSPYDASANQYNIAPDPDDPTALYIWQDPAEVGATDVQTADHYRYGLPTVITDNWSSGSALPVGLVYLWDHSQTHTIIEGATLSAEVRTPPRPWIIKATGAALDTWVSNYGSSIYPADYLTNRDNHYAAYYPANGLRVVTVGASASYLIGLLFQKFYDHDHSSSHSITNRPIKHTELTRCFGAITESVYANPSQLDYDDHPQYLHRSGILYGRDTWNNGLFGDLLFLSTDQTSNYQNLTNDSVGLRFGTTSTGPKLYFKASRGLAIRSSTYEAGLFFTPNGTHGTEIVCPYSTLGAGAVAIHDATSTWGSTTGGSIYVNRHKGGSYNDAYFGYNGTVSSQWGRVRRLILNPTQFSFINSTTAITTEAVNLDITGELTKWADASYDVKAFDGRLINTASSGQVALAICYINLPFAEYGIVGAATSIYPYLNSLAAGRFYGGLGYTTFSSSLGACSPDGQTISGHPVDLNGIWPSATLNTWTQNSHMFEATGSTSPLLTVSNDFADGSGVTLAKHPFVYFKAAYSAVTQYTIYFNSVIIYYRVKEF